MSLTQDATQALTLGIGAEIRNANSDADVERDECPVEDGHDDGQEDEESQTNLNTEST